MLHQKTFAVAAPLLHPGEQPVAAGRGNVGRAAVASTRALAAAKAVTLGGDNFLTISQLELYFLLTTERLLVFRAGVLSGRSKRLDFEWPRAGMRVDAYEPGFATSIRLSSAGESIRLRFPRSDQKDAQAFAAALGIPTS